MVITTKKHTKMVETKAVTSLFMMLQIWIYSKYLTDEKKNWSLWKETDFSKKTRRELQLFVVKIIKDDIRPQDEWTCVFMEESLKRMVRWCSFVGWFSILFSKPNNTHIHIQFSHHLLSKNTITKWSFKCEDMLDSY